MFDGSQVAIASWLRDLKRHEHLLSNEVAFCTLSMIHPITYALANTFKRSIVVVASLIFFRQSLPPAGVAGAAMALVGALGYSLALESAKRRKQCQT